MNIEKIDKLYEDRKQQLEEVRKCLCLKFYYTIEEKLASEKEDLISILNLKQSNQEMLQKYTFILDPQYFDQKFLKIL